MREEGVRGRGEGVSRNTWTAGHPRAARQPINKVRPLLFLAFGFFVNRLMGSGLFVNGEGHWLQRLPMKSRSVYGNKQRMCIQAILMPHTFVLPNLPSFHQHGLYALSMPHIAPSLHRNKSLDADAPPRFRKCPPPVCCQKIRIGRKGV